MNNSFKRKSEAENLLGTCVNITAEGHFGAVIGSKPFKDDYCKEKVKDGLKWLYLE